MKSNVNRNKLTLGAVDMNDLNLDSLRTNAKGRILDSPGVYIPNARKFKISLRDYDPLFEKYKIKKRFKPLIEIEAYTNKAMNKYMLHQIKRLNAARDNPKLYGRIALSLIKNSSTFRVAAFNHVGSNGHRMLPLHTVININKKVDALIKNKTTLLDYRRVYIPKDADKEISKDNARPLGVPSPEFRILLHMHANMLSFFLKNKFKHQHAYLPGLGTLTAGKEIFLGNILKKKYIHEGDFKGFFDNIQPQLITQRLRENGVPIEIAKYYERINISPIKLPKNKILDETFNEKNEEIRAAVGDFMDVYGMIFDLPKECNGVPQGAPTSPILANLIMQDGIESFKEEDICIAYADDSISGSDKPIIAPDTHESIIINQKKSRLVKENGKGLRKLKFLGLEFDGQELQANTRKGAKLLLNEEIKELIKDYELVKNDGTISEEELYEKLREEGQKKHPYPMKKTKNTGEEYFKSKLIGFIQNRMYNNSGNLENLEQDFSMKFTNSSGINSKLNKEGENLNIFNASSYASGSLANIFRGNKLKKVRLDRNLKIRRVQ